MTNQEHTIPADNPFYRGLRIRDIDDCFATGFSGGSLTRVYAALCESRHSDDLLLEAAEFNEVDSYYNPGVELVSADFILEAITIDRFSRTEKRMAAVVRVFNRHLADSELKALDPVVGTPKKSGAFAYVTVQLPFSDGQVVSVIFHAPEADKKRIGPADTIIAFRWLLNKRDITQVVAPEEGSEISLESIAARITQLVVKNSARFERQQKSAQEERKALADARDALKNAENEQAGLVGNIAEKQHEADTVAARLSAMLTALEKQKGHNAELEAKIAALKAQQAHNTQEPKDSSQKAPTGDTSPVPESLPFITTLRDILAGKYDGDTALMGSLLDAAAEEAEKAGVMDEHEALFNQAADHLTAMLKKRAA